MYRILEVLLLVYHVRLLIYHSLYPNKLLDGMLKYNTIIWPIQHKVNYFTIDFTPKIYRLRLWKLWIVSVFTIFLLISSYSLNKKKQH